MNPNQVILTVNPTLDLLSDLPIYASGYKIGASLLEPLVSFATELGFAPYWAVEPGIDSLPLVANQVIERNIDVPKGSFLIALTAASQRAAGFKFNLYDTGTRKWLFNRDASSIAMAGGSGTQPQPHIMEEPYPVLGQLNLTMTNLDNGGGVGNTNDMQLLMWFAVPVEPDSQELYPGIDPALPLQGGR
jgi:hypothetical protein